MVHGSLKNTLAAEKLHPLFIKAFEYIKSNDFTEMEPCKIELEGDKLIIIVAELNGKKSEEARMEVHRKYIDIQVPVIGTEQMGWRALEECLNPVDNYNTEKDILFFKDEATSTITVQPGEFAVFFPEDGHAPGIGSGYIKKIIAKIMV